jgi:hypothetical protein
MIYDTFKKRRAVREFDTNTDIPVSTVHDLLQKAWEVTPSKNNFMPYTIHVLGPEHQHYKNSIYQKCLANEGRADGTDVAKKYRKNQNQDPKIPFYRNIVTCSYLLIFTLRLEDQPNYYQRSMMANGCKFECTSEETLGNAHTVASLETGMFSDVFGGLCVESGLDVSSILCFQKKLDAWTDIPFVTRTPLLLVALGKAKQYKRRSYNNPRPNYDRIVNFVSLKSNTTTPTQVEYAPTIGLMTFTVVDHGLAIGSKISIAPESLTFTCALDNHATTHVYPRRTDPACYDLLPVTITGTDTFTVNVGISPNTSDHVFVSSLPNSISY